MKMRLELQKRKYIESERVTKPNWGKTTHEINYQGKKCLVYMVWRLRRQILQETTL